MYYNVHRIEQLILLNIHFTYTFYFTSRFMENWQIPSCFWSKTYEGAELAQNRGQIWIQHA